MKLKQQTSILMLILVFATLVFMFAGLPYSQFQWNTALAQTNYTTPETTLSSQRLPAYLQNPQTAAAYSDSNGGLTSGRIFVLTLNAAGVGNASVSARGLLAAADFQVIGGNPFAPFPTPVRACVRAVGNPVFIPKVQGGTGVPTDLPQAPTDGEGTTCAFIYSPGILAIVSN